MATADVVACVDPYGGVLFVDQGYWEVISRKPYFTKVAVSSAREVVALTASGEVYYKPQIKNTKTWQKITGKFTNVGISLYYMIGCNSAGKCTWMNLRD